MPNSRVFLVALWSLMLCAICGMTTGCGQKGPLYIPAQNAKNSMDTRTDQVKPQQPDRHPT